MQRIDLKQIRLAVGDNETYESIVSAAKEGLEDPNGEFIKPDDGLALAYLLNERTNVRDLELKTDCHPDERPMPYMFVADAYAIGLIKNRFPEMEACCLEAIENETWKFNYYDGPLYCDIEDELSGKGGKGNLVIREQYKTK